LRINTKSKINTNSEQMRVIYTGAQGQCSNKHRGSEGRVVRNVRLLEIKVYGSNNFILYPYV